MVCFKRFSNLKKKAQIYKKKFVEKPIRSKNIDKSD